MVNGCEICWFQIALFALKKAGAPICNFRVGGVGTFLIGFFSIRDGVE